MYLLVKYLKMCIYIKYIKYVEICNIKKCHFIQDVMKRAYIFNQNEDICIQYNPSNNMKWFISLLVSISAYILVNLKIGKYQITLRRIKNSYRY
jgi:hypothetical protein